MNRAKQIAITTDKRGKQIAYRVSPRLDYRQIRISLEVALLMLATGEGVRVAFKPAAR